MRRVSFVGYHGAMEGATDGPPNEVQEPDGDVTAQVRTARRGFRRDVAGLLEALRTARLFVPLARRIEDLPIGVDQAVGDELSLSPHLLFDGERVGYLPVFTRAKLLEHATETTRWTTGDGELEYVSLPWPVVLELALAIVDGERVGGLLLNPFDETELILHRHEIGSIAQGKPLPLVGYVAEIPFGEDEERLIAELDGPPAEALVHAVEATLKDIAGNPRHTLSRTFSPERDLEPHLTLNVIGASPDVDRASLAERLASVLDGLLPPPFYIDILFDDPKLS